jgi:hypothetical protein
MVSELQQVLKGIPQGSTEGPILIIVCMDDFVCTILHSEIQKYADDVKLLKLSNIFYVNWIWNDY